MEEPNWHIDKSELLNYIRAQWGGIDAFLACEPTFLDNAPTIIRVELNLYRAYLLRERFHRRLAKSIRRSLIYPNILDFNGSLAIDGYICINEFLPSEMLRHVQIAMISSLLSEDKSERTWHCRNDPDSANTARGSSFTNMPTYIEQPISQEIRKIIERHLYIRPEEQVHVLRCLHIHYSNDRDTQFHMDNYGAPTLKWFYFPFGTSNCDQGFMFCQGSHTMNSRNADYIREISPFNLRRCELQRRIPPNEIGLVANDIKHFNKENSLVIADTSAFHARSIATDGMLRVTIQGGLDSKVLVHE